MKRKMMCLALAATMLLCAACAGRTETPANVKEPEPQEQTQQPSASEPSPTETPATEQSAAEQTAAEQTDWTPRYASVLDVLCDVVYNGWNDDNEYPLLPTGVIELAMWSTGTEAAEEIVYGFADLNGDDMAELLVFEDEDMLIGGYTLVDGEPAQFLDGWYRNIYFLMEGGKIYNQGSGGAAHTIFGVYHLSADGMAMVCEDCYFTDAAEGTEDQLIFFHNTTGDMDSATSERFNGTEEEFWAKVEEMTEGKAWMPEVTPLSAYEYTGPLNQPLDCKVRLDYEEEVVWWLPESEAIGDYFPELKPTGESYETSVVFQSAEGVEQFKLLSLMMTDVDASGNPVFEVSELCALPELKAGVPLIVPMQFPGDMPTSGFSYVENGVERCFSVSQSGRDGALVVSEFTAN